MKTRTMLSIAALAAGVLMSAGCTSDRPPEDKSTVPDAVADPNYTANLDANGGSQFGVTGGTGWTDPQTAGAAADKDGWTDADPSGNRLGFPIIYFAYDSDILVPSETANLDKIAAYMQDKPNLGLLIEGHCDQRGTEEYNRALGERRANAIRAYLVSRGVADSKIKTLSYGEDKPAAIGNNDAVWRQNRRGVPVPKIIPAN